MGPPSRWRQYLLTDDTNGSKITDEDELAALRRKRMAEMMAAQKQAKMKDELVSNASAMFERKVQLALSYLLRPDAKQYLDKMKENNEQLYNTILGELFPPQVLMSIDNLLRGIQIRQVPSGIISLVDIQQLEREFLGIKSSISYKKRGEKERVDIGSLFKS